METKDYNTHTWWTPQQNQFYEGGFVTTQAGQQRLHDLARPQNPGLSQHSLAQKPKAPPKMPKAQALALVRTLKRWLVVASFVGFGTLSGLVAFHQVTSTTTTGHSTSTSSGSSQSTSSSNSSSQNNNNFLNQQGTNNFGSSSSSQAPVSGSHTS